MMMGQQQQERHHQQQGLIRAMDGFFNNSNNNSASKLELVDNVLDEIFEMEERELREQSVASGVTSSSKRYAVDASPTLMQSSSSLAEAAINCSNHRPNKRLRCGTSNTNVAPAIHTAPAISRIDPNFGTKINATTSSSKEDEKIPFSVSSSPSSSSVPSAAKLIASAANANCENVNKLGNAKSLVETYMVNDKRRFRSYQCDIWNERFQELVEFKNTFGHCLVPHNWSGNVPLAQWVKRQRYQYKLLNSNDKSKKQNTSTMSEERMNILNAMGFVWDSHQVSWEEKFAQLVEYKKTYGHCNVSGKHSKHEYRPLSIWIKCQRRQRKLLEKKEKSTMTEARIAKLDEIGFDWNPRNLQG